MTSEKVMLSPEEKELIWKLFRTVQNKTKSYIGYLCRQNGISLQEGILLREVSHKPGITSNELSHKLNLAKSTISSMITRLEENGMIERHIPKHNRRIVELRIPASYSERPEVKKVKEEFFDGLFNPSTPEDIQEIINGLTKLNEILNEVNL